MMRIHTKVVSLFTLSTVIMAFTSCIKDNVYDPTALQEEAKKAFPTTIGTNQTWNMVGTTTFNVGVNEDAGQNYTIKVLDKDPIGNSSAKLLATGTVTNGQTVALKFSYPLADSTLYIMRVDNKSRREAVNVSPVNAGNSNYTFGNSSTTKTRATTRAAGDFTDPLLDGTTGLPYTEEQLAGYISSGLKITDGMDISSGTNGSYGAYYVADNVTNIYGTNSGLSGKKIIIANGGKWTVPSAITVGEIEVIVASGGTIDLNGQTLSPNMASGCAIVVMPGGTITNGSLSDTNKSSIYNGGTLNLSSISWNGGYIVNGSGSSFYTNNITMNTSSTFINHSDNCHIITANNISNNAIYENTCKIIIDGDTFMPYNLTMSNGASLQCKNLILQGPSTVNLGNDAILKATNSTTVHDVTFTGPTSGDHAICVLGNIVDSGWGSGSFNNLIYVDITSNPSASNTSWSWWNSNVSFNNGASEVGQGEAKQEIPAGDCSIGYTMVDNGGDIKNPTYQFTYAFEDMMRSVGDYDFNDVVLKVSPVINGQVSVELAAAGATKNLYVHLNDGTTVKDLFNGQEIHKVLGVSEGAMVNTGAGPTANPVTVLVPVSSNYYGDFYITDQYGNEVHIPAFTSGFVAGNAPYALLVPGDWAWPKESVGITKAYTGFDAWAADATKSIEWYATGAVSNNIYGN